MPHDRFIRVELDHYTVIDEADDVVDLARVLNVDQLNLQAVWTGRVSRSPSRSRRPASCRRCSARPRGAVVPAS